MRRPAKPPQWAPPSRRRATVRPMTPVLTGVLYCSALSRQPLASPVDPRAWPPPKTVASGRHALRLGPSAHVRFSLVQRVSHFPCYAQWKAEKGMARVLYVLSRAGIKDTREWAPSATEALRMVRSLTRLRRRDVRVEDERGNPISLFQLKELAQSESGKPKARRERPRPS